MNSKDMKRIKESLVEGWYYYIKYKIMIKDMVPQTIIAKYCGPVQPSLCFEPIQSKHIYFRYVYIYPSWIEEIEAIDEKDLVKELFINGL